MGETRLQKFYYLFLILVCLYGVAICFLPDGHSLWLDELNSVSNTYCWNSFGDLFWQQMVKNGNPPLYQSFLYFWVKIFGLSEYAVRFPSAIFAVASFILAFVGGRKIMGDRQALLLAALLAVSWGTIRYAHEVRNYSLLLMLSVILMLQALKMIRLYRDRAVPDRLMFFMFLSGLFLCYTHFFGTLLYFVNLVSLLLFLKTSRKKIVFTGFLSALAFTPWLILFLSNHNVDNQFWIAKQSLDKYYDIIRDFAFYKRKLSWVIGLCLVIVLILQSTKTLTKVVKNILFPLSVIIFTGLAALSINHFFKPLIIQRYLIIFLPYIYLIISTILSEPLNTQKPIPSRILQSLPFSFSLMVLGFMLYFSIEKYENFEKQDWKSAANFIIETPDIDKIYCTGRKQNYWHYLRNSDIPADNLLEINEFDMISNPEDSTKISILWSSHDQDMYHLLRDSLSHQGFEIIEQINFDKYYENNYLNTFSRLTIFR